MGFQSDVWGFIGLVVCGFAVGAVIQFVLRSARRAAGPGKSLWAGMGRAFTGSRTRTAAYVVHFGMILVVAGLIGSNVYKQEATALVKVKAGQTASIAGYTLTYKGMEGSTGPQGSTTLDRDVRRVARRRADRHAGAAHRRVSRERGGGARRHPRPAVRRPLRSRRRAVRRHVEDASRCAWSSSRSSAGSGSAPSCCASAPAVSLWPKARRQEQEARVREAGADTGDAARADGATA